MRKSSLSVSGIFFFSDVEADDFQVESQQRNDFAASADATNVSCLPCLLTVCENVEKTRAQFGSQRRLSSTSAVATSTLTSSGATSTISDKSIFMKVKERAGTCVCVRFFQSRFDQIARLPS
jgi:hypothetical protein